MRPGRIVPVNLAPAGGRAGGAAPRRPGRTGACFVLCWLVFGIPAARAGEKLAETVQLGTVATLAPLCGLRDEAWAEDLRRAALQSATGTRAHDDARLGAAPGSALAASALGYAESEALENFAEAAAEVTCKPLAADPALGRADDTVRAFREQAADAPRF